MGGPVPSSGLIEMAMVPSRPAWPLALGPAWLTLQCCGAPVFACPCARRDCIVADTSRTGMYPVKCGSMWMNSASKFPSPSSMRLFVNPCLNCSQQFPSHFVVPITVTVVPVTVIRVSSLTHKRSTNSRGNSVDEKCSP